ncbi:MAG: type IV pilus modification PilV family protein [Gemmatimonadales bacterium]
MRNERGFTLISVLLAVSMLTIGLLALARTQAILTASESGVSNRAVALAIATDRLEQLRGSDPTTLASEGAVAVDANGQPSASGAYQRSVTVTLDQANLLRLKVTVTYPRMTAPVQLEALIYKRTS